MFFWGAHHLTLGMIVTKNRLLRCLHFLCELLGLKIEKEGWKGENTLRWLKNVVTNNFLQNYANFNFHQSNIKRGFHKCSK